MTYNFDPEQWLENQTRAVEAQHQRGEIDDAQRAQKLEELEDRYQDLVARLDGTYTIPSSTT